MRHLSSGRSPIWLSRRLIELGSVSQGLVLRVQDPLSSGQKNELWKRRFSAKLPGRHLWCQSRLLHPLDHNQSRSQGLRHFLNKVKGLKQRALNPQSANELQAQKRDSRWMSAANLCKILEIRCPLRGLAPMWLCKWLLVCWLGIETRRLGCTLICP